jgi:hypothetical protein
MPDRDEGITGRRTYARRYLITGSIPVMPFVFWHYLSGVTPQKGAAKKNVFLSMTKTCRKWKNLLRIGKIPS